MVSHIRENSIYQCWAESDKGPLVRSIYLNPRETIRANSNLPKLSDQIREALWKGQWCFLNCSDYSEWL